jgi:hypothetical protein
MERGSLKLVNTIEALLEAETSGSGLENRDYSHRGSVALITRHLYQQKLALTSPTNGCRWVGVVRLWTKATEIFIFIKLLFMVYIYYSFYLIQMISVLSFSALRAVLSDRSSKKLLRI